MLNLTLSVLSREWIGLAFALLLGAISWALWSILSPPWHWLGAGLGAIAALLALGALSHLVRVAAARRACPPQGKMVDLGGYRVHVLAEGEARGRTPIVWFGGSHSAGGVMSHLHNQLRADTRSILIDRPGTGWSDTGPFPRTTAREADEIVLALEKAGERGPFVFVGYSFGGLLVANIARRRPDLTAKLVLLDPTPLETIVFGPRFGALGEMRRDAVGTALLRLFGVHIDLNERRVMRNPAYAAGSKNFRALLGDAYTRLRTIEVSAGSQLANYSIYRELSPEGVAACAWETVVYDGDLGDLPLYLVAPGSAEDVLDSPEVANANSAEAIRMQRFFQRTRERYLAASSRSHRVYAPPGSTHQFVYEHPDFVAQTMRDILAS
jgi:pimeloyl-ACP methyl ester carboxylesterase